MFQMDTEKLKAAGKLIKEAMPGFDGNVQYNLSKNHEKPKINVNIADVTKVKSK